MATPIPENRAPFTLAELAAATGGEVRPGALLQVDGITTDTRGALAGKLFVALRGERFDGHDFVPQAAAQGATAVLVSRPIEVPPEVSVVTVADTTAALGALGGYHRRRWGGRLIAVGGAAGKTTTRAVTSALLGATLGAGAAFQPGNLNNLVGVPMVLLAIEGQHRVAVVELGTNAVGEVPRLSALAAPDIGVLTLIALEHTEGLGDLDAIEAEEGALLAALPASGVAIGNIDDERVRRCLGASSAARRLGYGAGTGAEYRLLERRALGARGAALRLGRPRGGDLELTTALMGLPGALAVAAGVAAAEAALARPLTEAEAARALDGIGAREPGRLCPVELADGTLLLDDTYNANPGSVRSSVGVAAELAKERGARLVLVLGEMRELGAFSVGEHRKLGAELGAHHPALVLGVGGDAAELVSAAAGAGVEAGFVADAGAAAPLLAAQVQAGDVVLVKASRGLRAERVVEALVSARGAVT